MVWACGTCAAPSDKEDFELEYVPADSTWSMLKGSAQKAIDCGTATETKEIKSLLDEDTGLILEETYEHKVDAGSVVSGLTPGGLSRINEELELTTTATTAGVTNSEVQEVREGPEEASVADSKAMKTNIDDVTVLSENTAASVEKTGTKTPRTNVDDTSVISENTAVLKTINSVHRAVAKYMKNVKGNSHRRKKIKSQKISTDVADDDTIGTYDDVSVDTNALCEALLEARARKQRFKAGTRDGQLQAELEPVLEPTIEAPSDLEDKLEESRVPVAVAEVGATVEPIKEKLEEADLSPDHSVDSDAKSAPEVEENILEKLKLSMSISIDDLSNKGASISELIGNLSKSTSFQDLSVKSSGSTDVVAIALSRLHDLINYRNQVQEELQIDLESTMSADNSGRGGKEDSGMQSKASEVI